MQGLKQAETRIGELSTFCVLRPAGQQGSHPVRKPLGKGGGYKAGGCSGGQELREILAVVEKRQVAITGVEQRLDVVHEHFRVSTPAKLNPDFLGQSREADRRGLLEKPWMLHQATVNRAEGRRASPAAFLA